jgi:hypothetical protein
MVEVDVGDQTNLLVLDIGMFHEEKVKGSVLRKEGGARPPHSNADTAVALN